MPFFSSKGTHRLLQNDVCILFLYQRDAFEFLSLLDLIKTQWATTIYIRVYILYIFLVMRSLETKYKNTVITDRATFKKALDVH